VELTPKRSRDWLDRLKIAILTEDRDSLETLSSGELPDFVSQKEMIEAQNLIREALLYLVGFRTHLKKDMEKIKANIKNIQHSMNLHHNFDKKI
jgi:hypothetical protein